MKLPILFPCPLTFRQSRAFPRAKAAKVAASVPAVAAIFFAQRARASLREKASLFVLPVSLQLLPASAQASQSALAVDWPAVSLKESLSVRAIPAGVVLVEEWLPQWA